MAEIEIRFRSGIYASLCWYALGRLGFLAKDADPADPDEAARLSELAGQFGFRAPIASGSLFPLLYQIPGYFAPETPDEMSNVFAAIKAVIINGQPDNLFKGRGEGASRWISWYTRGAFQKVLDALAGKEAGLARALDEWETYLRGLWSRYSEQHASALGDHPFSDFDALARSSRPFDVWEESFGFSYPYGRFSVVVCPESTTLASSLGPDTIVIGSRHGLELAGHSVIHEIGVRFLAGEKLEEDPRLAEALRTDHEAVLRLIEAEVCYRKPQLFTNLGVDYFLRGMQLEPIVEWRHGTDPRGDEGFPEWFGTLFVEAKAAKVI